MTGDSRQDCRFDGHLLLQSFFSRHDLPFSILQRAVIDPEGKPPPALCSPADEIVFCSTLIQLQLSEHYNQTQLFYCFKLKVRKYLIGWLLVFNATFNNISVIALWSVLLVKETGVPGENHQPVASH